MTEDRRIPDTRLNALHWDEVFREHAVGPHFPIEAALRGKHALPAFQVAELGELKGLSGVHLQCGVGTDTLALARMGAEMTGLDISAEACAMAEDLCTRARLPITFLQADVLERPQLPDREFDFVYTSSGVLRWLPRLDAWAANVKALLRPGGWLYMYEIHPLVYRLAAIDACGFVLAGDYFDELPREKTAVTTHVGNAESFVNRTVVHSDWSLSAIIGALIHNGLLIDSFREHPFCPYSRKGLLPEREDGTWGYTNSPIPLSFSIRATRTD